MRVGSGAPPLSGGDEGVAMLQKDKLEGYGAIGRRWCRHYVLACQPPRAG